ncbi:MAG: hypothetical protein M0011_02550 [Elusimicrobia bacterium]|nr:hypothetical protein [Elusimicrobiota bacterium]
MDEGKSVKRGIEERAARLFAGHLFGSVPYEIKHRKEDDSVDIEIDGRIQLQVTQVGPGKEFYAARAYDAGGPGPVPRDIVAQVFEAIDRKTTKKISSDAENIVLLLYCDMGLAEFERIRLNSDRIKRHIIANCRQHKPYKEVWAVLRDKDPRGLIKLYP